MERDEDRKAPPQLELTVVESAGDQDTRRGGAWAAMTRFLFGTHFLALADQAVVSGTSFLSTVLVGRWTVPGQLRVYTIGLSILGLVFAIQDALILLPYTIQRHHRSRTPAEHAGISLLHTRFLAAAATAAFAAAAMLALGANADLTWLMCALVLTVPFALQREFGRTYALAHLQVADALFLDASVAALQLGVLGWLGWTGRMSAVGACAALGVGCTLASVVWLYRARSNFAIRAGQLRQATAESWQLGKWLCAGQVPVSIQGYASYWILPLLIGMTETGVYAACNSIASLANPLLTAFRNTLMPRAVLAFKEGGGAKLRRQAFDDALLVVGAMSLFCLVILLGGDMLMGVVYHGPEYGGQGHVVTVLAVAVLAGAAGAPASMERPQAIVLATSVGAVVTVVVVWILSVELGMRGAAYGLLAGNIAGAAAHWVAFQKTDLSSSPAQAMQVLREFTRGAADGDWSVRKLDEGEQANVFVAELRSRRLDVRAQGPVVIKLYKSTIASRDELAGRQFECLSRSHALLRGRTFNGWRISAPVPLYMCRSPLALVMTMVPGRKVSWHLRTGGELTRDIVDTAPQAVVAAMTDCWAAGQSHGDLNVDNILLDPVAREISFVDLDLPPIVPLCGDGASRWRPASHDLAYMLYDAAMRVKPDVVRPGVRARKLMFAERILRAFVGTIAGCEDKMRLLDEIRACARLHLEAIEVSWSSQGQWRRLLRRSAARSIDTTLERLKREPISPKLPSSPADALARRQ
jgi:O-antigen/teichoic acid export membrane protein